MTVPRSAHTKTAGAVQAITNHCFPTLRAMSAAQQGLLIDSIVWAFRHTERNVADTGLQLLSDMLNRFAQERDLMGLFLQSYYLRLMQEIFAVLTDTMHKPGFRLQVRRPARLLRAACIRTFGAGAQATCYGSNAIAAHLV